jgi:hypothetical protein
MYTIAVPIVQIEKESKELLALEYKATLPFFFFFFFFFYKCYSFGMSIKRYIHTIYINSSIDELNKCTFQKIIDCRDTA